MKNAFLDTVSNVATQIVCARSSLSSSWGTPIQYQRGPANAFPLEPSRFSHLTIIISGHESLWISLEPRQTWYGLADRIANRSGGGYVSHTTKTLIERIAR